MQNYEREDVIRSLIKAGLKPAYVKGKKVIQYFKKPRYVVLGTKLWGMIDFLKINVVNLDK